MIGAVLRQLAALAQLMYRHLTRRAIKAGAAPTQAKVPSFLILSVVWAGYIGMTLWSRTRRIGELGGDRASGTRWLLYGVLLFYAGAGLVESTPELGKLRSPLKSPLLDELPVSAATRTIWVWMQQPYALGLAIVVALAMAPEIRHARGGIPMLVAMAIAFHVAGCTAGLALLSLARVGLASHARGVVAMFAPVMSLAGVVLLMAAGSLARVRLAWLPDPMLRVAAEIAGGHMPASALAACGVVLAIGLVVIALVERRGYDRLDTAPPSRTRSRRVISSLPRAEARLFLREPIGKIAIVTVAVSLLGACLAPLAFVGAVPLGTVAQGLGFLVAYAAGISGLNAASAAVRRDVGARALLAPLPLSPWDTLAGKTTLLRWVVMPLSLAFIPLVFHAHGAGDVLGVVWRAAVIASAIWLVCDAAVSVAFLTSGLGSPGATSLGAPVSFANQLLFLPLLATAAATHAFQAVLSLAMLLALTWEARRAARRSLRWLDDGGDVERETAVWRALLTLAVFFASQALSFQVLHLSGVSTESALAITIFVSAGLLVLLTLRGLRGLGQLRFRPDNWTALPMGAAGGLATGLASIGLLYVLRALNIELPASPDVDVGSTRLLALAMVVAAPIGEEIFFRGWLQTAISVELSPARRRYAFVIAACAFAGAHLGSLFIPQLLLGLVAGALFARSKGLLPGMLAHAAHNGMVLFLSVQ